MKRDLDLCRQLLADIEGHGPDTTVTALRPGLAGEADERVRYHVRLLIDAGLVKELDRAAGGAPCVRLTNAGHDFLELAHSEARWREAKWVVAQRTGGVSLEVLTSVLKRWAYDATLYGARWRPTRAYRPAWRPAEAELEPVRPIYERPVYDRPAYHRVEPRYRYERDRAYGDGIETTPLLATRRAYPSYLERFDWRPTFDWRDATDRGAYYVDKTPRYADPLDRFREEPVTAYRPDAYASTAAHDGLVRRDGLYRNGFYRDWVSPEVDGASLPIDVV